MRLEDLVIFVRDLVGIIDMSRVTYDGQVAVEQLQGQRVVDELHHRLCDQWDLVWESGKVCAPGSFSFSIWH